MPYKGANILIFTRTRHEICNATAYQTEHPRFIIREHRDNHAFEPVDKLRSFVNFVPPNYYFVSVNNPVDVYAEITFEKCSKKEIELRTAVAYAEQNPRAFAFAVTGEPGRDAHIRGEAAVIIKCTPVPARRRPTDACFAELPVIVNGEPRYLLPRSRIISSSGTEIACNPETASMYKMRDRWYALVPELERAANQPVQLQPRFLAWGHGSSSRRIATSSRHKEPIWKNDTPPFPWAYKDIAFIIVLVTVALTTGCILSMLRRSTKDRNVLQQQHFAARVYLMETMHLDRGDDDDIVIRPGFTTPRARETTPELICSSACIDILQERSLHTTENRQSHSPVGRHHAPAEILHLNRALAEVEARLDRCSSAIQPLGSLRSPSHR